MTPETERCGGSGRVSTGDEVHDRVYGGKPCPGCPDCSPEAGEPEKRCQLCGFVHPKKWQCPKPPTRAWWICVCDTCGQKHHNEYVSDPCKMIGCEGEVVSIEVCAAPSSPPALPTSTETERERLAGLLQEAIREYADHQSWRCAHPDRYPLDEVDPPDCPCGLHRFTQRVEAALAAPSDRDERGQGMHGGQPMKRLVALCPKCNVRQYEGEDPPPHKSDCPGGLQAVGIWDRFTPPSLRSGVEGRWTIYRNERDVEGTVNRNWKVWKPEWGSPQDVAPEAEHVEVIPASGVERLRDEMRANVGYAATFGAGERISKHYADRLDELLKP